MEFVLITGGTSGIGYELARIFAEKGYGLALAASSLPRLEAARGKLAEFGVPIHIYEQDLGVLGGAQALFEKITADGLEIGLLVNNAGYGLAGATESIDFGADERMMVLNAIAPVELCKRLLPGMYRRGRGAVLNVCSTGAFQPGPFTSTYFASKAFLLSYSRAVRYEAAERGVRVCALCPGATRTEFFQREGKAVPEGAMSARAVAEYACAGLERNRAVMVPGAKNRLLRLAPMGTKMDRVAKLKRGKGSA